jgi:ADP-ribosyl-[dinitrogen reductase] hydrolase
MLARAFAGAGRASASQDLPAMLRLAPKIASIARATTGESDEIRGSGYVVLSLEAALWSFATTLSYRDAVLRAANLGEDADTTAAICGQLAGAFYGEPAIPAAWREKLAMRDLIEAELMPPFCL